MESRRIIIHLFGAFKSLGTNLTVDIEGKETVAELKKLISEMLNGQLAVLACDSVIANQTQILQETDRIENETILSILPPVCGG